MMATTHQGQRKRRGVEAIEFAMILPLFFIMIFAIVEFSWYMFQRGLVVDAARRGCHAAAQLDPSLSDFPLVVSERMEEVLLASNMNCQDDYTCAASVTTMTDVIPPRVNCTVTVNYRTLTGFFGQTGGGASGLRIGSHTWGGVGLVPSNLRGQSSAILEGVD